MSGIRTVIRVRNSGSSSGHSSLVEICTLEDCNASSYKRRMRLYISAAIMAGFTQTVAWNCYNGLCIVVP